MGLVVPPAESVSYYYFTDSCYREREKKIVLIMSDAGEMVLQQLRSSLDGIQLSTSAIYAGIIASLGGALLILLLWLALWHHCRHIFAPKAVASTKLRTAIANIWRDGEADCIQSLGVDAVVYLQAIKMLRNIFLILTIALCSCAISVDVVFNYRSSFADNLSHKDALLLTTPTYVQGTPMVTHVVLGWFSNLIVFIFIWRTSSNVLRIRREAYAAPELRNLLASRSVLLIDLPKKCRNIRSVAGMCTLIDKPSGVALGYSVEDLEELLQKHSKAIRQLEKNILKFERCGRRPSYKGGDAIDHWTNVCDNYAVAIMDKRKRVHEYKKPQSFAFVSFQKQIIAQRTAKMAGGRLDGKCKLRLAPSPEEIIWENISLTRISRAQKQAWVNVLYAIFLVCWIVPNAFIGCFISNLSRLAAVWPAFGTAMNEHKVVFGIIQGFLAPLITNTIFSVLPFLFRRFSRWQGKITKIEREKEVLRKLYVFYFFDNYFVFSVMGVIWDIIAQVLEVTNSSHTSFSDVWHTLKIPSRIATAIVNLSSFWVMYLLRGVLGLAWDMIQSIRLLKNVQTMWHKSTPREISESRQPTAYEYARQYLSIIFQATIAFGFTSIQPLVLPCVLVYFTVALPLKKYTLMYSHITKYESYGSFWPLVNNMVLFSVGFGNLMLLCVVWVQAGWKIAIPVIPLVFTVIIFKIVTYAKFDARYEFCADVEDSDSISGSDKWQGTVERKGWSLGECYENPALVKPLDQVCLGNTSTSYFIPASKKLDEISESRFYRESLNVQVAGLKEFSGTTRERSLEEDSDMTGYEDGGIPGIAAKYDDDPTRALL